jgi:ligand-binding sensor domain-containing protein
MRDGLPQNSVVALLEDQEGLIWVATFGGVATFDGVNFEPVDHDQFPGLVANRFLSLAQTPDGTMFLGSEHDGVFRIRDGRAEQLGPKGTVWAMVVDQQGQLFALVGEQVLTLKRDVFVPVPLDLLPMTLGVSEQGAYASGRDASPVCLSPRCSGLPSPEVDWRWSRWTPTGQGWIAMSDQGIFLYQDETLEKVSSKVLVSRRDQLCSAWDEEPWCLWGVEPTEQVQVLPWTGEPEKSGGYDHSAYLQDHEGGLWVGDDGSGLYRYQKRHAVNHYVGSGTVGVVATPWDEIWFVSAGQLRTLDGVVERSVEGIDPSLEHLKIFASRGHVYELLSDDSQAYLVHHEETGSRITQTLELRDHGVAAVVGPWLVRNGVLHFLDDQHQLNPVSTLGTERVVWPLRGDDSGVWLGERAVGVHRFEGGAIQATYPWTASSIRDVVEVDGELWAATYGDGVVRLAQDEQPRVLGHQSGMCDAMVSHLYLEEGEYLWFNGNAGLGRISVDQMRAYFAGEREDVECSLVGSAEGNGSYGAVDSQGRYWAATIEGLSMVDPKEDLPILTPRLSLSQARYGDKIIQDGDRVRGSGSLTLSDRGLRYSNPKGVR